MHLPLAEQTTMVDVTGEIKKLRDELDYKLKQSESAAAEAKVLRAKIDAAQRQITEQARLAQAIAAKKAAYANEKLGEAIATGVTTATASLEATSPGKPKKIDEVTTQFNEALVKRRTETLPQLETTANEQADKAKNAEAKLAAAKTAFENAFKIIDQIGATIEQIKALRTKMNQAETADDHVAAYVYVKEAAARAAELQFPDEATLSAQISERRSAWLEAAATLETAKTDAAKAKANYDKEAAALAADEAKRIEKLLEAARKA
jgi:hypothetical protein